jgi:hypothetical protein
VKWAGEGRTVAKKGSSPSKRSNKPVTIGDVTIREWPGAGPLVPARIEIVAKKKMAPRSSNRK